jgi:hypothetical protein
LTDTFANQFQFRMHMRKIFLLFSVTAVALFLWGFSYSDIFIKRIQSESPWSLSYNPSASPNKPDTEGQEASISSLDVSVPEVHTIKALNITASAATFEGRVEKFEYIDGPKPDRTGDREFRGGVVVKDGRIVLVPRTGQFVGEYNPVTNTILQTAKHGQEGGFGMGVVLEDGYTVILTPRGSRNVGIYNALTQTYRDGARHERTTDNAFLGCVQISPELIIFGPLHAEVVGLYNPLTDTYTDGPAHNEADSYNFSVITRSSKTGNVIFTPFYSRHVGIYDPVNNTYTSGAAHHAGVLSAYSGSVELENGHILMAPRDARHVGIYDPVNDTFMQGPEHGEGAGAFMAAEMMPDGEVIMAPFRSHHVGIYEPSTGVYRSGPSVAHVPGVEIGRFSSAVLTQSKDMIVMTNRAADVIGLVRINPFFQQGNQAEVFFCYRQAGEKKWKATEKKIVSEHGIFNANIKKLKPATEYEYKSIISYKAVEKEGDIRTFTTSGK